jgi:hypothetical protein
MRIGYILEISLEVSAGVVRRGIGMESMPLMSAGSECLWVGFHIHREANVRYTAD